MENDLNMVKIAYQALDEKFGIDITVLDIRQVSVMADYFIIASGNNPNAIRAMADEVIEKLHKSGLGLHHVEGMQAANWVLIDFNDLIIHIFDKESRQFYNLERVWGDAKAIRTEDLLQA